ncbi:MAG TPA: hypothetical protein VGE30_02760 [Candidatus Saccharimonadales bacterium]
MTHAHFSPSPQGDTVFEAATLPGEPVRLPEPRSEQSQNEVDPEVIRSMGAYLLDADDISD